MGYQNGALDARNILLYRCNLSSLNKFLTEKERYVKNYAALYASRIEVISDKYLAHTRNFGGCWSGRSSSGVFAAREGIPQGI